MSDKRSIEERREERRQAILAKPTWEIMTWTDENLDPRSSTMTGACYSSRPETGEHRTCPGYFRTNDHVNLDIAMPCACPCHVEPHWHDRYALKHILPQLTAIQEVLKTNRLIDESTPQTLWFVLDHVKRAIKAAEKPRFYIDVDRDAIIDRETNEVAYGGIFTKDLCNFTREEACALTELLNEGYDRLEWEQISPMVDERVKSYGLPVEEAKPV